MRIFKIIPLGIATFFLAACGTGTADPIVEQMNAAGITTGALSEEDALEMVGVVCESRENLSHEWVVGMLGMASEGTWSEQETEDFVELAYVNGCPDSRP